jgi:hypothetical protein
MLKFFFSRPPSAYIYPHPRQDGVKKKSDGKMINLNNRVSTSMQDIQKLVKKWDANGVLVQFPSDPKLKVW